MTISFARAEPYPGVGIHNQLNRIRIPLFRYIRAILYTQFWNGNTISDVRLEGTGKDQIRIRRLSQQELGLENPSQLLESKPLALWITGDEMDSTHERGGFGSRSRCWQTSLRSWSDSCLCSAGTLLDPFFSLTHRSLPYLPSIGHVEICILLPYPNSPFYYGPLSGASVSGPVFLFSFDSTLDPERR